MFTKCVAQSERLIAAQKGRAALHDIEKEEYTAVRGIYVHVPTRSGSRHMVMQDVYKRQEAFRRLAATETWPSLSVQHSAAMTKPTV
jgi:hypothetical protein